MAAACFDMFVVRLESVTHRTDKRCPRLCFGKSTSSTRTIQTAATFLVAILKNKELKTKVPLPCSRTGISQNSKKRFALLRLRGGFLQSGVPAYSICDMLMRAFPTRASNHEWQGPFGPRHGEASIKNCPKSGREQVHSTYERKNPEGIICCGFAYLTVP